jgi:hypothetical protein
MSYTHTLSIQGVHASLQMNVEHSVVRYTLTMRAESGEEVVAHGQLPNNAMDEFMVINQYVNQPAIVEKECVAESPVIRMPFSELIVMERLQRLRECFEPDIKNNIVDALQQYLSENNVNLLNYPTLCEFMKEFFYEMIVLHINDDALVGKFIKMMYLAGEESHNVVDYMNIVWRKYGLFCKVAAYYKIALDSTSFADYRKWNATYDGPVLNRWNSMKTFLLQ